MANITKAPLLDETGQAIVDAIEALNNSQVPPGGLKDDVLTKNSNTDYDLIWTKPLVKDVQVNGTTVVNGKTANIETVNVLYSNSLAPLAAAQGKILNERINNLKTIGRFLAIWNAKLGKPLTQPTEVPYAYITGDYFRVGEVAQEGEYRHVVSITGSQDFENVTITIFNSSSTAVSLSDVVSWLRTHSHYEDNPYIGASGTIQDKDILYCSTHQTNPILTFWYYNNGELESSTYQIASLSSNDVPSSSVNYQPYGATYTGEPSTEVYSGSALNTGDVFYYDSITWIVQHSGVSGAVTDVQSNGTSIVSGGVANITSSTLPNITPSKIVGTQDNPTLNANLIPELNASKITSGTLGEDRIPAISDSKILSASIWNNKQNALVVNPQGATDVLSSIGINEHNYTFDKGVTQVVAGTGLTGGTITGTGTLALEYPVFYDETSTETTSSIKTLFTNKSKTIGIYPRTKTSAITDANNVGLDTILNSKSPYPKLYSNINVQVTPTELVTYNVWDSKHEYGYKAEISAPDITATSRIINIVMTDIIREAVAPVYDTDTDKIILYTKTNSTLSGTIFTVVTTEVVSA